MTLDILAAYDGSDEGKTAIEYACEIRDAMGGSLTVVHAVQPDVYEAARGESLSNFPDEYRREILKTIDTAEEQGQEYLKQAESIANDHGQEITKALLYGNPVTEILDYTETEDVDMIVLGHRGQSKRPEPQLGSIAKTIIERADVPVLITR